MRRADMATTIGTLQNFIDGERVPSEGESEPVLNPATGEELARAPQSTAEDVDRAVKAARKAFAGWSQTTPAQRSQALPVLADNLRFFAGAARCQEGRAAGEYMEGYTSFTRREAIGVIGQVTPWNYPLM